ncbi:hypothetical protein BGZ63DRAFT_166133 [Mariannaea sp. PMI_226]|nr:hypothetical protein BGZ63DRAFT_166133 [Mariannaea sp. PMI_226]
MRRADSSILLTRETENFFKGFHRRAPVVAFDWTCQDLRFRLFLIQSRKLPRIHCPVPCLKRGNQIITMKLEAVLEGHASMAVGRHRASLLPLWREYLVCKTWVKVPSKTWRYQVGLPLSLESLTMGPGKGRVHCTIGVVPPSTHCHGLHLGA